VGLQQEFGPDRCMDTPLAENGIVGAAIGMALYGLRPVAEIQFADYVYPAFDQIVNELAKMRYRSGGEYTAPVVIRMPAGGGVRGGHYHSQSPEAVFIHTPGLQVVYPSNPADTKGLLASAIRGEDPVIFLEPKRSTAASRGEVPPATTGAHRAGQAVLRRAATRSERSVTILAWGGMVQTAIGCRGEGREHGLRHRARRPAHPAALRRRNHLQSVQKTGRVVIVHEAPRTCGFGAELAGIDPRARPAAPGSAHLARDRFRHPFSVHARIRVLA
jgi:pyruvate dehydrogenase E1 component beta subunit